MPKGGRNKQLREEPQGGSGGGEPSRPYQRASTPIYDDGSSDMFIERFTQYAAERGWSTETMIQHLRGTREMTARIEELRTRGGDWPEIQMTLQMLQPSPVGPDGLPIRMTADNLDEFFLAYEEYCRTVGVMKEEYMRMVPQWAIPGLQRDIAQIGRTSRDWEDCKARIRSVCGLFQYDSPRPRVERRRRSDRVRGTERGRAGSCRRREVIDLGGDSPPSSPILETEHEAGPEVRVAPEPEPEMRPVVEAILELGGRQRAKTLEKAQPIVDLQELEAYLEPSQWPLSRAVPSPASGAAPSSVEGQEQRLVPKSEEARDPAIKGEEVWQTEASRVIDAHFVVEVGTTADVVETPSADPPRAGARIEPMVHEEAAGRAAHPTRENPEEHQARVTTRLEELERERDKQEATGILPNPPVDKGPQERGVDAIWAGWQRQRDADRQEPQDSESTNARLDRQNTLLDSAFTAARGADRGLDDQTRWLATTSFDRYSMLSAELVAEKLEVEDLARRLEKAEVENKEQKAASQAKKVEWERRLREVEARMERFQSTTVVDRTE
ncbi:hypothetical protein CBR_g48440 [Chara braunii]|uniref:Uncharacterized protein n=1 Tax=Chara braunii TaxID=69332 RepID=A0A388M2R0_CHABU|nr:hypothetical protein CBR_g48440 [Chara braunii]|eukprot:GBG88826.1 hypothetical protein CBR_g48440 [Chara braunii]